jgi:hypothetical protein
MASIAEWTDIICDTLKVSQIFQGVFDHILNDTPDPAAFVGAKSTN